MATTRTEGVIAINKPAGISSAQALRDLQSTFNPSQLFAPWIAAETQRQTHDQHRNHNRRKPRPVQVKLGHGGTLDPEATGVLIVGVGQGTKQLPQFLDGTKSYEAVVMFGAATDTYDGVGKVVGRRSAAHITKQSFEEALRRFRGDQRQKPPIFSALRMDGKRLYEYAIEGKEPPRPIETRPVRVDELELVEWMEGGTHRYSIPENEADERMKKGAIRLMEKETPSMDRSAEDIPESNTLTCPTVKRKNTERDPEDSQQESTNSSKRARTHGEAAGLDVLKEAELGAEASNSDVLAPAVKIRMTVSSGFYVRSLCHDIGMALNSFAFMASLTRTRQSSFELGKNVLEWDQLSEEEEIWAPKIEAMLEEWRNQQ